MEEDGDIDFELSPATLRQCERRRVDNSSRALETWMQMEDDLPYDRTEILVCSSTYVDSPVMCSVSTTESRSKIETLRLSEEEKDSLFCFLAAEKRDRSTHNRYRDFNTIDPSSPILQNHKNVVVWNVNLETSSSCSLCIYLIIIATINANAWLRRRSREPLDMRILHESQIALLDDGSSFFDLTHTLYVRNKLTRGLKVLVYFIYHVIYGFVTMTN